MTRIELFHFSCGDGWDYRYTSAQQDVEHGGHTWEAGVLSRRGVQVNASRDGNDIHVEVICDGLETEVVREYDGAHPTREVACTIFAADLNDIDETIRQVFPGVVSQISRDGKEATFRLAPRHIDTTKMGPKGRYSTVCRWRLYSTGCGVTKSEFKETVTTTNTDADDRELSFVLSEEQDDDYFLGGVLEFGGVGRRIVDQEGPTSDGDDFVYTITLHYWIDGLGDNDTVTATPGCSHSFTHCDERFDNRENFGGIPTLEVVERSPFFDGFEKL